MFTDLSTIGWSRLFIGGIILIAAVRAEAQDPRRLPGVVVSAKAAGPGAKLLVGRVLDTLGYPVEGAEVSIGMLQRRTLSKADGTFHLGDLEKGSWSVRVRKIGFGPIVRDVKLEKDGGRTDFELVPWPSRLRAVVVSVMRGGLSGAIADTAFVGIPDVEVKILGKAIEAFTDSSGSFFIPVRGGSYMVSIKREGYAERVASVTVPEDSGRFLTAMLYPAVELPIRERWNVRDLGLRQTWRHKMADPFFTREDIIKRGYTWIYDLVRAEGMNQYSPSCWVTVDGGPSITQLATLTVDDVEAVELFNTSRFGGSGGSSSRASLGPGQQRTARAGSGFVPRPPLQGAKEAGEMNRGMRPPCPVVFIWSR